MTTTISAQNVPTNTPPSQPYGSMDQVSSGPAGILYTLANELTKVYDELQDLYNKMTVEETNLQSKTIEVGAKSQIAAANLNALSIGCQAAGSFASALVTGVTTSLSVKENLANSKTLETQQTAMDKIKPLENLKAPRSNLTTGNAPAPQADPISLRRAAALKDGNFNDFDATDSTLTPDALLQKRQEAVNAMSPDDYREFKSKLLKDISAKERAINTTQLRINNTETTNQQRSQMFTTAANTLSQGGQAGFTAASGSQSANKDVSGSVTQMASSTADNTRSNINAYYSKVSDAIAAARQGAQAYAQT